VHTPEYPQIEGGKIMLKKKFEKKKNSLKGKSVRNIFLIFFKKPRLPRRQEKGEIQLEIIFFENFHQTPGCHVFEEGENQLIFLENLIMNLYP
jgi:hypothetical protein